MNTFEVIRQFQFHFDQTDLIVKVNILKQISSKSNSPYMWVVSHHYDNYRPSKINGASEDEVISLMENYMRSFDITSSMKRNNLFYGENTRLIIADDGVDNDDDDYDDE